MALAGIRVVDVSRLLPGGYCSLLLGDLGADVVKVEVPGGGDLLRGMPPVGREDSRLFLALSRNKRSAALDLKQERGREVFGRLVERSDVLLESFRPGVMERLGLDYARLRALNPRLIYCAITGYGQDGPDRDLPGHDINYLSRAGLFGVSLAAGQAPASLPVLVADFASGMQAAVGILAALVARAQTGRGQMVDVSLLESALALLTMYADEQGFTAPAFVTGGLACYGFYRTRDAGWLSLGCLEPKFWQAFCQHIGHEEWVGWQSDPARQAEMRAALEALFATRDRDDWLAFFAGCDTCLAPVRTTGEVNQDPQVRHRAALTSVEHPIEGSLRQVAPTLHLSDTPARIRRPPPRLGEHTAEVLAELGYSTEEVAALRRARVI